MTGFHQVALRGLENVTGVDMMKLIPSLRIPTDKIPACQPHPGPTRCASR